jgi:hypothetical protein
MTGREGVQLRPLNWPAAISEPVKVIEPITTSRTVATLKMSVGAAEAAASFWY